MGKVILFLIFVPIVEFYLLFYVGDMIGWAPTLAWVMLTGVWGVWLSRREGLRVLGRWQESLARQEVPQDGAIESFLIFAEGLMLMVPGFLTDAAGLVMIIPLTRNLIMRFVRNWLARQVQRGRVQIFTMNYGPWGPSRSYNGDVIDVEGELVEEEVVETGKSFSESSSRQRPDRRLENPT